jgi:hypothetical protein
LLLLGYGLVVWGSESPINFFTRISKLVLYS